MPLAELPLLGWRHLLWFDLRHGLPIAMGVLRARLGWARAIRACGALAWRAILTNPLRGAPDAQFGKARDRRVRHQVRQAFLLDDVLVRSLGMEAQEALPIIRELVGVVGARYIALNAPFRAEEWRAATPDERRRYTRSALTRFANAEYEFGEVRADGLNFDVTYCRIAELAHALGRGHLAPLFCWADAVYFDGLDGRPTLERPTTLADGHDRCRFVLAYPDDESG